MSKAVFPITQRPALQPQGRVEICANSLGAVTLRKAALTVDEFCFEYGVGRTSVYAELKSGRLKAKKRGDTTLIPRICAEQWLEALPDYTPAQ